MAFNPFHDLDPADRERAIEQMGGANTTDLNIIRNRLRTTTSQVKGIVNLLKRKNSTVKQDLDRIKLLDRRLKRVIPIIPGMAGVAGAVFGGPQRVQGRPPGGGLPPLGGLPGGIPRGPGGRPTAPTPVPVTPTVPVPEKEREREREPEKVPEQPPVTIPEKEREREREREREPRRQPQWEWPELPPFILPPLRDLPGLAYGLNNTIVAKANALSGKLNAIAKDFGFDFNLDRDKLAAEFAKLPEQLKAEQEKQAKAGFLQNLKNPNFLIQSIALQQTFGNLGRPGRDKFGDTAMKLKLASRFARLSRTANLTRRTPIVSAPAARMSQLSAPYEEIVKGLSYATREGRRIGGTTVRRRAPLMQGFETGGLYRKGPTITPEERAMRQALMDIVDEETLRMLDDPKNVYSQLARADVDKIVAQTYKRADDIAEQIFGIKTKPAKKAVTSMNVLKSPRNFMNSFMEGDIAIPPGSVADILGLNNDALRKRFGYYLLQAPPGRKEQYSNFIYKISKDLGIVPGKSTNQLDDNTVKFLMRFFRPSANASTDIRPGIFKKLQEGNFVEKDKLFGEFLSIDDIKNLKDPAQIPGVPDPKLLSPGAEKISGPRSSVMGVPLSMDIASLNSQIDNTDIVIVLTGPKPVAV